MLNLCCELHIEQANTCQPRLQINDLLSRYDRDLDGLRAGKSGAESNEAIALNNLKTERLAKCGAIAEKVKAERERDIAIAEKARLRNEIDAIRGHMSAISKFMTKDIISDEDDVEPQTPARKRFKRPSYRRY
jgi:hypothetical protein